MDFWVFILVIPVTAIAMGIGHEMLKSVLRHRERKLEIMAGSKNAGNETVLQQIQTLRDEIARLRDTSTQYDISIQHTLDDLQHRMERVESKHVAFVVPIQDAAEQPAQMNRS